MDVSKPLRVLLVDGDPEFVRDVTCEFNRNAMAVKVAHTLAEAKEILRLRQDRVDVAICALHLPDGRAECLLPDIEAHERQPAAIIISESLPDLEPHALEYRPVAVSKPISPAALLRVVRTVVRGYARPLISRFVQRFRLTKREAEATRLLAQGLRVKEIANHMSCSEKTVYAHLVRVAKKTGCRDYHEVVCALLAFTCHTLGHTPPAYPALASPVPGP